MILNAGAMQAQTLSAEDHSLALLPLQPMGMTATFSTVQLDAAARDINTQMVARSQLQASVGFSLDQLPIVGELVDEKGNFDWGMELPISVNVGDVLGSYGVTVGTDFSL